MTGRTGGWLVLAVALGTAGLTGERLWSYPQEKQAPKTAPVAQDQSTKPEMNVYLIGDAGAPAVKDEPVLQALEKMLDEDPSHSVAVFMGDNIYPDGMPDSVSVGRKEAERRLQAQLEAVKNSKSRGIFIAGNHDWGGISGRNGFFAIRRQGAYIAAKGAGSSMMPEAGCPGPAVQDVGTRLRLVMLDTQWWLARSRPPNGQKDLVPCAFVSQKSVLDSLKKVLRDTGGRRVLVMSHHPLASQGTHGGYFSGKSQIFPLTSLKNWLRVPLPMVGSVYVAARRMGLSEQDLTAPQYIRLVQSLMGTFTKDEPLVYAAGHEHSMQVMSFQEAPRFLLVSGTGIYGHVSAVGRARPTRYAAAESGFMRVRAWADGRIRLTVFTIDNTGKSTEAFDQWLVEQPVKLDVKIAD